VSATWEDPKVDEEGVHDIEPALKADNETRNVRELPLGVDVFPGQTIHHVFVNDALANNLQKRCPVVYKEKVARERAVLIAASNERSRPNPFVVNVGFSKVVGCRYLVGEAWLRLRKMSVQKVDYVLHAAVKAGVISRDVKVKQSE
jgi:hypothetical protein